MTNVINRLQGRSIEAHRAGKHTIRMQMTTEEAAKIAYVVRMKAERIIGEPLRSISRDDPNSAICIDCRMHGTWAYVPHAKNCPYRVARRLCGMADIEDEGEGGE